MEKIGFTVTKARVQRSGTQHGFDILIILSKDYTENKIFIECKNYGSDLSIGNIVRKGLSLEANYRLDENDLFIAINPKSNFANEDNSEKLSPVLSNKFPFSYYALDLSNGVKELFALDKVFFEALYEEEVSFEVDEEKELNRFKNIIFSRKPFKKIIIKTEDKVKFIGDFTLDENYIERTFSEELRKEDSYFKDDSQALGALLNENSHIFVLGNPGSGKSTELVKLALSNWSEGEVTGYVPIFKSLKNFTSIDTVESYLPENWMDLSKILLILDGIDEIHDIESFKSKFQNFIERNVHGKKDLKYVISCRTNIYESIVLGIPQFKTFYLQDLTYDQGIELLQKKCGNFTLETRFNVFLKTPFLIDILADYITVEKEGPSSTAKLWKVYIDKRLTHDKKDKLVKISIDPLLIKKYSKKTALINELMKTSVFDEEILYAILKENSADLNEFKKNPLLDKIANEDVWFFEHRNIQEYFAALVLSELSFERIKDFIVITESSKTHPSLFNTISFLLNIIEGQSYEDLVKWLADNEPELLFKADSDRTGAFQVPVFKHYFTKQCIEKGFWISTNRTFSALEIARFGDCEENLEFLLKLVQDDKCHFRIVISALNLLNFFTIGHQYHHQVKNLFIDKLGNKTISNSIKAAVIRCSMHHQFLAENQDYLNTVFSIFKLEDNQEINNALLSMIRNYKKIGDFFWYIKGEFLRIHNIVKRSDVDDVVRGNNGIMDDIIVKIKDSSHFIELISFYFNDEFKLSFRKNFSSELVERFLEFSRSEEDFVTRFLKAINGKTNYYVRDNTLFEILVKCEKALECSVYLIENNPFEKARVILARIADRSVLELIRDQFQKQLINSEEIHAFRNNLWFQKKKASYEFEAVMEESGFKFDKPLLKEEGLEELQAENNRKIQINFDILFDKTTLLNEIKVIFKENNLIIGEQEIRKIENEWYDNEDNWSGSIDSSISILHTLVYAYGRPLSYAEVEDILQDGHVQFHEIEELIKHNVNSNIRFTVSKDQEKAIKSWCVKASSEIGFNKIIITNDENEFFYGADYSKFRTIFDFFEKYDFELPKDFLLNSLEYFDFDWADRKNQEESFFKLISKINDADLAGERIADNIRNKKLFYNAEERHIDFALNYNLQDTFSKIREYLKEQGPDRNFEKRLEKYFDLTGDIDLMKECCADVSSHKCWPAINILTKLGRETDFCVSKAIDYLELPVDDKKYYVSEALLLLFQQNRKEAVIYYTAMLKHDLTHLTYHTNYSIVDYKSLEEMFFEIYSYGPDRNKFNNSGAFLTAYVSNLSESDQGYENTQKVLNNIKEKLNKKDHDSELFHIHALLDHSTNGYINSKSKSMNFENALRKTEEITSR
ncbi:NACHT domain-containing protein [Flavobacterium sp. CF108]|uniref:NACHT domain-containing protein n=1 Tax=Flavobacterium sp. CF108 TaxID=1882758 RepID=UPI0013566C9C|nr:hypothetical protein [Flavobacterium sp. CF108]